MDMKWSGYLISMEPTYSEKNIFEMDLEKFKQKQLKGQPRQLGLNAIIHDLEHVNTLHCHSARKQAKYNNQ